MFTKSRICSFVKICRNCGESSVALWRLCIESNSALTQTVKYQISPKLTKIQIFKNPNCPNYFQKLVDNFCVTHICTNRWGLSKKWMFTRKWTREQIWGKWTKPETRPTNLGIRKNWNLEQNAFLNVLPLCDIIYVLWSICCRKRQMNSLSNIQDCIILLHLL